MKPLQAIAMGFVFIVLIATVGAGYDLYADPVGWLLVVVGVAKLPADFELRPVLMPLSVVALIASVPLWLPQIIERLEDGDESIAWAVNLPSFGFLAVCCLALVRSAQSAGERTPAAWFASCFLGTVGIIVLPVLVFGGGVDWLNSSAGFLVQVIPLVFLVVCFVYAGREWAGAPPPEEATAETESSA